VPPLPNLPTDNLYKFAALLGFVLAVIGIVGPLYVEHVYLDLYGERFRATAAALKDHIRWVTEIGLRANPEGMPREKGEEMLQTLKSQKDQAISDTLDELKVYRAEADNNKSILRVVGCFGGALAFAGFLLWYVQVQRPQDQTLAAELKTLNLDLAEKANAAEVRKRAAAAALATQTSAPVAPEAGGASR
jgi:hypothetical protein